MKWGEPKITTTMKLDCLLYLEATGSVARLLQKAGRFSSYLKKNDDFYMLFCQLAATELHYLHVKVPCPVKDHPKTVALLMIPHSSVLLALQSDQKKALGFAA